MTRIRREPNFTARIETAGGPYEVRWFVRGEAAMSSGIVEPGLHASIFRDGQYVTTAYSLNSTTLCLPGYGVRGPEATAAEIVAAVLGDEHIFTGAPSFPAEHDTATALTAEAPPAT